MVRIKRVLQSFQTSARHKGSAMTCCLRLNFHSEVLMKSQIQLNSIFRTQGSDARGQLNFHSYCCTSLLLPVGRLHSTDLLSTGPVCLQGLPTVRDTQLELPSDWPFHVTANLPVWIPTTTSKNNWKQTDLATTPRRSPGHTILTFLLTESKLPVSKSFQDHSG